MRADGIAVIILLLLLFSTGCAKTCIEISGSVVDADTEKPLKAGAVVRLVATTRSFSNSCDTDGKFTIRYMVTLDQGADVPSWLLVAEAPRYETRIIPMFQSVRLFGYYLRRKVVIRLKELPDGKSGARKIPPEGLRKDPLAFGEAIRRMHALSKFVYKDALRRRAEAEGDKAGVKRYSMNVVERRAFTAALAAHMAADTSSALRREAARVAWRWNSPEVVHALLVTLEDGNKNVRYWASRSLQEISGASDPTLYRDDDAKTRKEKVEAWWDWYRKSVEGQTSNVQRRTSNVILFYL